MYLLLALGERVRQRREQLGLTQRELAERAGLSLRFLALLERGDGNISLLRFADVAKALACSPSELLATPEERRPLVSLLGVRGAGKTSIGQKLAHELDVGFFELDDWIEKAAGLSLAEIFELHGEAYFRRLERETLRRFVSQVEAGVLATGGSIVMDREAFRLLKERTTTIWLKAKPEEHWNRVLQQGDARPMAKNPQAFSELRALLAAREPLYRQAELVVDTSVGIDGAVKEIQGRVAKG